MKESFLGNVINSTHNTINRETINLHELEMVKNSCNVL